MALLGIRGTGSFVSDERPKNWREGILRLYPNGAASLTAFLALLDSEASTDPEYSWWEKDLPTRFVCINNGAGYLVGDVTFTVDDCNGANPGILFRAGDVLLVVRTGEHLFVSVDQTSGTSVTVTRAFGETAAAALLDNDELRLIGNANEEGALSPNSINFDPTKRFNYNQIFRSPLKISRTAKKTRLRTEDSYRKAKADALEKISIDMEDSFIWGERLETTGAGGLPIRTTRGIYQWINADANQNKFAATAGTLNETELLSYLEPIFRFGSTEKLGLMGSTALNVLTQIAKGGTTLYQDSGTEMVYGIRLKRYMTAFGDLLVKQHPLFNRFADWRKVMLILDLANLRYRYIDDLQFLRDRQAPDRDARQDEFLAESGLEVHHSKTFGYISDVGAFGA
jgi:hypothetical protein